MAGNKSLGEQFLELKEELKQEREARAAAEAARDAAEEAWAAEQQQQQATRDTEQRAREAARDAAQRAREEARDAEHKEQFSLLMQKLSRVGLGRGSKRRGIVTRRRVRRPSRAATDLKYPLRLVPERTNLARADKTETPVSTVSPLASTPASRGAGATTH